MENYLLIISLVVIAALCWMAGVVKVLLAAVLLGAVVSLATDPKMDRTADGMLMSALLGLSGDSLLRARPFDPELDLDPVGLIRYHGYPAENHWVTTDDGYVLGVHRIPRGRDYGLGNGIGADLGSGRRPAVIMAHPLLSSSSEWIVAGPGKSLAYILADEGYDVWLLNVRGNTYSLNHTSLSTKDAAFWDFTFHEHAVLDLPAVIQHVVRETGQQRLQYVGFSMGTTIMFAMSSLRPDMAAHIKLFTALAPPTDLTHTRSLTWRTLGNAIHPLMRAAAMINVHSFLPSSAALRRAGEIFCSDGSLTQSLCVSLIAALSGRNDPQTNRTLLPYIISRTPSGTSFKNIDHFSQLCNPGGFTFYDYGTKGNLERYGSPKPPKYDLSKVRVPVRIHYGMNDHLADWKDAQHLCSILPNVLSCAVVPDPLWTHLDFVWAKDVPSLLYPGIVADMKAAELAAS